MIAGVRGILERVSDESVHIDLSGLIFNVVVPASVIGTLGAIGDTVHLFTHLRIRDEQPILYGFNEQLDLDLFLLLLSVSGVGPRTALGLISSLGASGINQAIESGDLSTLRSVSGVGGRTAGRLILELKGKFDSFTSDSDDVSTSVESEIVAALVALGYSPNEARQAVQASDLSTMSTVEDGIRHALMHFSK